MAIDRRETDGMAIAKRIAVTKQERFADVSEHEQMELQGMEVKSTCHAHMSESASKEERRISMPRTATSAQASEACPLGRAPWASAAWRGTAHPRDEASNVVRCLWECHGGAR